MGRKGTSFGLNYQKSCGKMAPTKLGRDVRGNSNLYKVFCDIYRTFYILACL